MNLSQLKLLLILLAILLLCGEVFAACVDDGSGNFTCDVLSGTETESSLSGITLIKDGAGETILTGNNDFTSVPPDDASIKISGGTLSIAEPDSLTGDFKLNLNGGTFKTEGEFIFNNEVSFNGGNINVAGEESVLSFTGMADGASLTKEGLGLFDLKTSTSYSGNITINEGGVETNSASFTGDGVINHEDAFLSFMENSDNTFEGSISGSGIFIKEDIGTLTIDNSGSISANTHIDDGAVSISSDTHLTGNIDINKGSLIVTDNVTLNKELSFGTENTGVEVAADKTLTIGAGAAITAKGCDELDNCSEVIKDGAGTLVIDKDAVARYSADTHIKEGVLMVADGDSLGDSGYTIKIDDAVLKVTDNTTIDNHIEVLANTSAVNIADGKSVTLDADTYGAGVLNKTGNGTLALGTGILDHDGGTVIEGGTLQGNAGNLAGNIQIDGGTNLDIVQDADGALSASVSGLGAVNKKGDGTLTLNAANPSFLGDFNVSGGSIKGSSQAISSDVNLINTGASVIFDQNCVGAACEYTKMIYGMGSLVKTGDGLLVLTGTNSYGGGTYLQNATRDSLGILFGADSALGTGDIFMSFSNLSLDQNKNVSTSKNFIFSGQENSLSVLDNSTYTINGVLSGTSFTKLGGGELILTGANTHYGGTQITEGALSVHAPEAIGTGILAVTGGTFKPLDDMDVENNVYLSAAAGQGGFLVDAGRTLTLNGILSGGGTLNKTGEGTLELGYYNSYLGGVYAAGGLLRGDTESILGNLTILSGAEVEFKQNFDGYYTGDIDSAGTITKTGAGILIAIEDDQLPGGLNVGTLNVNEGVFIAQSALHGDAYVSNGAILSLEQGGEGHFETSGLMYLDHADDVDFKGNIVVKDGGVLGLVVQEGKSNTFNVRDTDISSGKGHITIEDGGKINITASGVFENPAVFDFLTYSGTFNYTGALTDLDVNVANNRRLAAVIQDSGGMLSLLISRLLSNYSAVNGLKYNQKQIAVAVDRESAAPSSDFENILNAVDDLAVEQRPQALTQLGGFMYANLPNYFNRFKDTAYLRINRTPAEESTFSRNVWVQSVNNYADIKENENSEDIYNFSSGFAVGFDNYFEGAGLTAGLFAGYARHDLKHNKTENLDGDEYQFGAYALKQSETFDFKGALSAGYQADEIERDILFVGRKANSKVKSYGFNADIEAGVKVYESGNFSVRPFAGIAGGMTQISSFEETGANSVNLSGKGESVFTAQGKAGVGIEKRGKSFSYYADASVKQNLNNPQYALNISGQQYKIKSADVGALLGFNVGGVKRFSQALSVYANGGADINGTAQNYYFNAGLRSYW
jgi:autotransporter-associated beta strand protein